MQNFLDAVRSRKHEDLTAEIDIGPRAAGLVHLANISYRLGRRTWTAPCQVHRRQRSQQDADARLPETLRGAGKSLGEFSGC